ncbi:MAG: translocation/assembly module TamB domain-containing protein [Arachidicoccus sp.]|nr:translocation/assembly module TamB domain-containing protein [Arachidicoccus sp.]
MVNTILVFKALLKSLFIFRMGMIITLNGPETQPNANLHIDARYTAQQVSLSSLLRAFQSSISSATGMNDVRGYRGDVYVIVQLRGKLLKPDIGFKFDFPVGSSVETNPDFRVLLQKMTSDENEMLKQVAYLIAFNSFAPLDNPGAWARWNASRSRRSPAIRWS